MTATPTLRITANEPRLARRSKQSRLAIDSITVLATLPGKVATKQFIATKAGLEKRNYGGGYLFGVLEPQVVGNIVELSTVLKALETLSNCLVVRGTPRNPAHIGAWVQRTGSGSGGNFETPSIGRHWILIDIDKVDLPQHLSLNKNPVAVCEHLVHLLPGEFHDASYHWSLSSSAGIGDPSKVSMHLWFWLKSPVADERLNSWAKEVNKKVGFKLIDPALFQHVQAHYTAAPIFKGMKNPFPVRSGLHTKRREVVDLIIAAAPKKTLGRKSRSDKPAHQRAGINSGFAFHLSLIGDHVGGQGFHPPIVAAVASYVGTYGKSGTDVEVLYKIMRAAVLTADARLHDADYPEQMASRDHIIPAIESAIRKYGSQPSTRRKTRLYTGIEPHFKSQPISIEEAMRQLTEIALASGL